MNGGNEEAALHKLLCCEFWFLRGGSEIQYYEAGFNWPKIWVIVLDKTPQAQTGPHTLRKDPTRPTQSSDMPRSSTKPIVETFVGYWRAH